MPVLTCINSFVSIISLVLVYYINLGFLDSEKNSWVFKLELTVGFLFLWEFIYNILNETGSIYSRLFSFDRIIEICNTFEVFY